MWNRTSKILICTAVMLTVLGCSKNEKPVTQVKSLLVQQLKNTHTNMEWFVPTKTALDGLTLEQSNWKDSTENHSIGELVSHLIFWNEMNLRDFKGERVPEFKEENKETFRKNKGKDWYQSVKRLDSIQTEWEQLIESANEKQIEAWSAEIANMASHTAYHTGQIMYIRKRNGWWD